MRLLFLIVICLHILHTNCKKETCEELEDCENFTSEYSKYRECMEKRTKRSIDCDYEDSCDNCDCSCSSGSCNSCAESCCQSSCTNYNCCHRTCRAECRSTSCRSSCKKRCHESIINEKTDKVVVTNATGSKVESKHNITTIIHLNNLINNTNVIHLPVNVNNTNVNNITLENWEKGHYPGGQQYFPGGQQGQQYFPGGQQGQQYFPGPQQGQQYFPGGQQSNTNQQNKEDSNCCLVIGPRQCLRQKEFPFVRCFHIRKKQCGPMCSAPLVHYQKTEICDNEIQQQPCRQQVVYIPQPRPSCAYQPNWPYVNCGNSGYQSCDGCYNHYVNRAESQRCSTFCYDDGYGSGPYYRQGPYYRPGYNHAPSCYQTGTCGQDAGGEYGAFGYPQNSYVPPYFIEDTGNANNSAAYDWTKDFVIQSVINHPGTVWSNETNFDPNEPNIQAEVHPVRSERYAEIKIRMDGDDSADTSTSIPNKE